jgi:hypothetical protein
VVGRSGVVTALFATSASLLAMGACSSFGGETSSGGPADGGGQPDAIADGAADADDAGAADAAADLDGDADADVPGVRNLCPPPDNNGSCVPGACAVEPVYTPPPGSEFPWGLVTDTVFLYWVAQLYEGPTDSPPYDGFGNARIYRMPKGGGAAVIVAPHEERVRDVAVDGARIYWVRSVVAEGGASAFAELRSAPRLCTTSCAVDTVVPVPSTVEIVRLVRLEAGVLFAQDENGHLFRIDVGSTPATVLDVTSTGVFPSLALTDNVYVGGAKQATLAKVSATGLTAPFTTLSPPVDGGDPGALELATDCTSLYVQRSSKQIERISLATTTVSAFANNSALLPIADMTADARYLYTAGFNNAAVRAYDLSANPPTTLVVKTGSMARLYVDDHAVYWGDHGHGTAGPIWRMKKD